MQRLSAALPPTGAFLAKRWLASDRLQSVRALRHGLPHPGFADRPAAAFAAAQNAAAALLLPKFVGAGNGPSLELFTAAIAADVMLSALSAPAAYPVFDAGALPTLSAAVVSPGPAAAACALPHSGRAAKHCAAGACRPARFIRQPRTGKSAPPAAAQSLAPHRGAIKKGGHSSGRSLHRHRSIPASRSGNLSPTAASLCIICKKAAAASPRPVLAVPTA